MIAEIKLRGKFRGEVNPGGFEDVQGRDFSQALL